LAAELIHDVRLPRDVTVLLTGVSTTFSEDIVGRELPEPNTPQLDILIADDEPKVIYEYLYRRRSDPPTMIEVREHVASLYGSAHSQTDRRLRDLRDKYRLDVRTERAPARLTPSTAS
jgi:hypothetical protein